MSSDPFKSACKSLKDVLTADFQYFVPIYQRGYCWDTQVEQFWDDLLETINANRAFHFFGPIALKRDDTKKQCEIIDGQQRLATATILISLIRERLMDSSPDNANLMHNRFIAIQDIKSLKNSSIITLNEEDRAFFEKYIIQFNRFEDKEAMYKEETGPTPSNRLIFKARALLKTQLDSYVPKNNGTAALWSLHDTLLERFYLMETVVNDEADAFVIFETLNDRGLDLTIADLLKNFLFSKADAKLQIVRKHWDSMTTLLGDAKVSEFLRHYWLSSHGVVRQIMLYKEIKDHLKNKDVVRFIEELSKEAEIYAYLKNPSPDFWVDNEVYSDLRALRTLNVTQCLPFLLSAHAALPPARFKKVVRLAVVMSFRYSTICNKNARNLEDLYSDIALKIRAKHSSVGDIRADLATLYPDDVTFKLDFLKKSISIKKVARYILVELNAAMHSTGEEKADKVSIEHIVPQSPEQAWTAHLKKHNMNHKDIVDRIGNLTLLGPALNKNVARELFPKKLSYYRQSTLPITRTLLTFTDWTNSSIDSRQKDLAEKAVTHWKL